MSIRFFFSIGSAPGTWAGVAEDDIHMASTSTIEYRIRVLNGFTGKTSLKTTIQTRTRQPGMAPMPIRTCERLLCLGQARTYPIQNAEIALDGSLGFLCGQKAGEWIRANPYRGMMPAMAGHREAESRQGSPWCA